jgi:hypothetical protein
MRLRLSLLLKTCSVALLLFSLTQVGWSQAVTGALAGRAEAQRLLDVVLKLGKQNWLDPYNVVPIYEALGDRDEAFRWLDRAIAERSSAIPFLHVDPWLDGLRSDQRFAAALRRAGL